MLSTSKGGSMKESSYICIFDFYFYKKFLVKFRYKYIYYFVSLKLKNEYCTSGCVCHAAQLFYQGLSLGFVIFLGY